ncbi:hypothetical protein HQQ81_21240 [Microbacteriaceae bacterium VKM Ac-2854]|nr:hypothetical protein [Microbacteriaceae bacterium VKM Ac-2854]
MNDITQPNNVRRRTIVHGAAWTIPAVAAASAAPMAAASNWTGSNVVVLTFNGQSESEPGRVSSYDAATGTFNLVGDHRYLGNGAGDLTYGVGYTVTNPTAGATVRVTNTTVASPSPGIFGPYVLFFVDAPTRVEHSTSEFEDRIGETIVRPGLATTGNLFISTSDEFGNDVVATSIFTIDVVATDGSTLSSTTFTVHVIDSDD